jgi:Outer membrane protein beta-barrel family/Carboxypeptidase regulatory-like domain
MKQFLLAILIAFTSSQANAQQYITVTGAVKGSDGKALPKATVKLYYAGQKDTLSSTTNDKGEYIFELVKTQKAFISITYVGYKKFVDEYDYSQAVNEQNNFDIIMTNGNYLLETVTITSSKISIKEDTVSYKIDSTMYRKNDNVEQLVKQLPGVEVDKDGNIKAQGKEVTRVKVNGKDFFNGDVKTATRQLDADMVDKIQIVDDYGDQAAFTGIRDGEPTKTMNIQLKKDRNKGVFGNVTLGVGTEERYENKGNLNFFNNDQQISINGGLNNTNASNFDFSRLPGGAGGGMGAGIMRSFGGLGGFNFGNSDGIGVTKTAGINYRDDFGKKVAFNGSYSFSTKDNQVLTSSNQQQPKTKADSSLLQVENAIANSVATNHRFNANIEYTINKRNFLRFTPVVSFRSSDNESISSANTTLPNGFLVNQTANNNLRVNKTPNFTGNLIYNHAFKKKGRTISFQLNGSTNRTNGEDSVDSEINSFVFPFFNLDNEQFIEQDNSNNSYSGNVTFTDRLSKTRGFDLNYTYSHSVVENNQEAFNTKTNPATIIPNQTNLFENIYTTHRIGGNYRITQKKYNYSFGLAVQPATITSNSFTAAAKTNNKQNIVNYFPVIRFAYNYSKSKSLSINYNGATSQPSIQQSQPVPDVSNPQNITIGNPSLRPEFRNTLAVRYNNFNFITGDVFFGNLSVTYTDDKIVANIADTAKNGRLFTEYRNTDGNFNANAFYNFSKPWKNRKYVFNYGGSAIFANNLSYRNGSKFNNNNIIFTQRVNFDYKLKMWLETNVGFNYTLNKTNNSLNEASSINTSRYSITQGARMFFKYDWVFTYDISADVNKGLANTVSQNPVIVGATLEKQFLKNKNAAFKLQAYDLLNENTNISRNVSQNGFITDTRTNRLQRYFTLSFIYRFNKFKGASQSGPGFQGGPGGGPRTEIRMGGGPGF